MSNIKSIILGYIFALCLNGCDLSLSSNEEDFNEALINGLGSSPFNPVYVKIVE